MWSRVVPEASRESSLDTEGPRTVENVMNLLFYHGVGLANTWGVRAVRPTEVLDRICQFRGVVSVDLTHFGSGPNAMLQGSAWSRCRSLLEQDSILSRHNAGGNETSQSD